MATQRFQKRAVMYPAARLGLLPGWLPVTAGDSQTIWPRRRVPCKRRVPVVAGAGLAHPVWPDQEHVRALRVTRHRYALRGDLSQAGYR